MTRARLTTMTVSKVETDLINATTVGGKPHFIPGHVWVEATDGTETHRWPIQDPRSVCVGVTIEVVVVEYPPIDGLITLPVAPPALEKRFTLGLGDTLSDASTGNVWIYDGAHWAVKP